ncbi:MAG: hypothetical protein GY868_13330 [Deltaproteobacteria bacterium]|nr:hypothetical protein [Deltaproteobacteria bacterium]
MCQSYVYACGAILFFACSKEKYAKEKALPILSGLPELEWFAAAGQELAALKQPVPCFRIKPLKLGTIKMGFETTKIIFVI